MLDVNGRRVRFKTNKEGNFLLSDSTVFNPQKDNLKNLDTKLLIPDDHGDYLRQWRPGIRKPDDIWNEIVKLTNLPGLTSAPKLQPIQTRLVMLSTGMRAPMGLKVYGPDLESIENAGLEFEKILKEVPSLVPASVFYDRAVGSLILKLN